MSRRTNRRDFLRTSAAAGAGLWTIGAGPSVRAYAATQHHDAQSVATVRVMAPTSR